MFPHGKAEIIKVANAEVGRYTFEPGWRWSTDVQPIVNTASCEATSFLQYITRAGELAILMDDGTEFVAGPGRHHILQSGHDAWVLGRRYPS